MKTNLLLLFFGFFIIQKSLHSQEQIPPLVIRFNYSLLDFQTINNSDLIDFIVNDVLNESGKKQLNILQKSYPEFGQMDLHKLFPFLTTNDTVSISRTGEKVTIPPFWATFHLDVPNNIDYLKFMYYLDEQTSFIDFVHPEFKIEFTSVPDDTLYYKQYALNEVLPDAHINVQ